MKKKNVKSLLVMAMVFYGGSALASPELSKEEAYHQARQGALHKCNLVPAETNHSDCVQTINQAFDDMRDTFLTEANVKSDTKQTPATEETEDPKGWEQRLTKAWSGALDIMTFEDFRNSPEGFWNHTKAFAKSSAFFVGLLAMAVLTAYFASLTAASFYAIGTLVAIIGVRVAALLAVIGALAIAVTSGVKHLLKEDTDTTTAVEQVDKGSPATSPHHTPQVINP